MPCGASAMCCGSRAVFPSIRARLTVWLALLVMLCLAAFAVYLYVAVHHILTANLDQTLRVQAHQIAAIHDFDVLEDLAQDKEKDQRRVDLIVGGESAASRVWAEVLDRQGHLLTRSSNLGRQRVPLPAPASTLLHAAPRLVTQAGPGGALHVYSWPAIDDDDGQTEGLVVVAAPLDKVQATTRLLLGLLVAGGLGLLLLAVLGSGVLVRRGLRPLEEMA